MNLKSLAALTLVASAVPLASAGPLAYGLCLAGCNGLAALCYSAAGFTFGATIVWAPPAILACNAALGVCTTSCAATFFGPTP